MHGGPRNLKDEALGHDTFDAFAQGYLDAQREKGARPFIQRERYSPSTSYNIIKAFQRAGASPELHRLYFKRRRLRHA